MKVRDFGELVQLRNEGKIGYVDFLLQGVYRDEYLQWLDERDEKPNEDNAELFFEETKNILLELGLVINLSASMLICLPTDLRR